MFVIPLDAGGTWFRLHHLFAEFLCERLMSRDPQQAGGLHKRAAEWHLQHGDVSGAVHALVGAGRYEAAGELLTTHHAAFINTSRLGAAVSRWLSLLPPTVVAASAPLCLTSAWVAGVNGRIPEMEDWLARAASIGHEGPLPDGSASVEAESVLLRACCRFADLGVVLEEARTAAQLDRPESSW
jgi:LuxR family maltose regulon positive regulatory protein